jgi:rubrerythrin
LLRLKKHTVQKLYKKLTMTEKQKAKAKKKLLKKREAKKAHKQNLKNMFGKLRYYLAIFFGEWVLWTGKYKGYVYVQDQPEPKAPKKKLIDEVAVKRKTANKKQVPAVAVCEFCGGEDIFIQGTKAIMPCPTCKRNSDKVRTAT